jgi:hypothetical protein
MWVTDIIAIVYFDEISRPPSRKCVFIILFCSQRNEICSSSDSFFSFSGTIFKAHKLILAACSKNFADLFETPSLATGSVCVILEATSAENMSALLEFMYKGEVHVSQKALESFLKAAESLQVSLVTRDRFVDFNSSFRLCLNR